MLLLGVGVPLWWHTTAVPRVSLPYAGIEALSDLDINIKTKIVVVALSRDRAESLVHHITDAFKNSSEQMKITSSFFSTYFFHIR